MTASCLVDFTRHYRVSHYVQVRFTPAGITAESLITGRSRQLNLVATRVLLSLAVPASLHEVISRVAPVHKDAVEDHVIHCVQDGLITEILDDGTAAEDKIGALRGWEAHDLGFHLRSRRGRSGSRAGATWHLRGVLPSEPVRRQETRTILARHRFGTPTDDQSALSSMNLDHALLDRRTHYSVAPISERALGALLYNSCRVTESATHPMDVARRLYPSGGCRHSLEIYVLVHRCPSIESGAYRYEPFEHTMDLLRREDAQIVTLLREAQLSTGALPDLPSTLLVFTSRLYRVTEKYQSIGYRLVLLEVGALYQTIYLVATALGLSVSAIGTGDSDCFSKALGTDYFSEPSVGEMIIAGSN